MTYEEFMRKPTLTHAEMIEIFGGTEDQYAKLEKEDRLYDSLIHNGIPSDRAAALSFSSATHG